MWRAFGFTTEDSKIMELKPRIVTAEEIKAVSLADPIYAAGAQAMLKRGLWILKESTGVSNGN